MIIEYFGLKGNADYDEDAQRKRRYWAGQDGWTLVEFSQKDLRENGQDGFVQLLLWKLKNAGVKYRRRSEEEIWTLVRRRAVDGFSRAITSFVGRCRKRNLAPDALESMVIEHTPWSTAEALFLTVGLSVYRGFLQRLAAEKKEDFDGLVWRSVSLVREGETQFVRDKERERGDLARLKFAMIDEFQDFSSMFCELVDAVRSSNPNVQFFCVGDDWQAINGFAGSDTRFFDDFAVFFRRTSRLQIRTNYRSARSVVGVGNALMRGRGLAAEAKRPDAGSVRLCDLDKFVPSRVEAVVHDDDELTPAVLRLVRNFLDREMDVVLLSRTKYVKYRGRTRGPSNQLEGFREHVRSFLPEEDRRRVDVLTVHKHKGLEQSAVIVLDANRRRYPLIHPYWFFYRVFGDSVGRLEDEERRLFYVALTRAKDSLVLLTEAPLSPHLADIGGHLALTEEEWDDLQPVLSSGGKRHYIRVFDAHHAKDQLRGLGYQWIPAGRYWSKAVEAKGFSFDALLQQPWAESRARLEVYSEKGELLHHRWTTGSHSKFDQWEGYCRKGVDLSIERGVGLACE